MDEERWENLSKRQFAYVYAMYKQGRLHVGNDAISLLYDLGKSMSVSEYEQDEIGQIRANLRSIVSLIAEQDFDRAEQVIRNLYAYVRKEHEGYWNDMTALARRRALRHARANRSARPSRYVDYSSYSGYEGMDYLGMDAHDLGYDW